MSSLATHLTTPAQMDNEGPLTIEGEAYRHLFRARRLALGDSLRVVDGAGRARRGAIYSIDRKTAQVELHEALPSLEAEQNLHLLVGAPRPERASWLVEKATEMGVRRIIFIATERTGRDYGAATLERWRRVAKAAVEQCGRARVPKIEGIKPLSEALGAVDAPLWALVPGAPPLAPQLAMSDLPVCHFLIGPEGGLSKQDLVQIEASGGRQAGLCESILRVETAAIAALSCALMGAQSVIT